MPHPLSLTALNTKHNVLAIHLIILANSTWILDLICSQQQQLQLFYFHSQLRRSPIK